MTSNGIKVEPKIKVVARLGRSTDKGDAVVMAWYNGLKNANIQGGFRARNKPIKVITKTRSSRGNRQ